MQFKGIEKNSLIEWPGKAVTVVYTGGCNFRCPFCQNSDLVLRPESLPSIEGEEIIEHLNSREKWLDGLMITGGEPTIHPSLTDFSQRVKREGFEVGVETNGSKPEKLEELLKRNLVDRIALDVKAPLEAGKYQRATGIEKDDLPEKIEKSMRLLRNSNVDYEYRTTVVPRLLNVKDMMKIGNRIRETEEFFLQQFVPKNTLDKEFESLEPYSEKKLKSVENQLKKRANLPNCEVRNL